MNRFSSANLPWLIAAILLATGINASHGQAPNRSHTVRYGGTSDMHMRDTHASNIATDIAMSSLASSAAPRPDRPAAPLGNISATHAPHPALLHAEPVPVDQPLQHLNQTPAVGHPKIIVHVTAATVLDQFRQRQVTRDPVYDIILGTSIQGTALSHTSVTPHLLPNNSHIEIALDLHTRAFTETTGTANAATVYNRGVTEIAGRKRVLLTPTQFLTTRGLAEAEVQSDIVGFDWKRHFGERIARQRAEEQKPQAERISSAHTGDRAGRQFDRQVDRQLLKFESRYRDTVSGQLSRMPMQPDHVRFRSTSDAVIVDGYFGDGVVGAWPPQLRVTGQQQGIAIQLHQSLLDSNLAQLNDTLAGQSFGEEDWSELGNLLPESSFNSTADRRIWTLGMPAEQPVKLKLSEAGLHVSVKIESFQVGDNKHPGMLIEVDYMAAIRDGQLHLDRSEKLTLTPLDEDGNLAKPTPRKTAGGKKPSRRLGVRQQIFRSMVRKRFDPAFAKSIPLGSQHRSLAGNRFKITKVEVADEWATLQGIPE